MPRRAKWCRCDSLTKALPCQRQYAARPPACHPFLLSACGRRVMKHRITCRHHVIIRTIRQDRQVAIGSPPPPPSKLSAVLRKELHGGEGGGKPLWVCRRLWGGERRLRGDHRSGSLPPQEIDAKRETFQLLFFFIGGNFSFLLVVCVTTAAAKGSGGRKTVPSVQQKEQSVSEGKTLGKERKKKVFP